MQLNLGVIDVPEPEYDGRSVTTTYAVAESLEDTYGLFTQFVEIVLPTLAFQAAVDTATLIDCMVQGVDTQPYGTTASKTVTLFRQFLDSRMMDHLAPGVPTKAATEGRRRLKGPDYRGESRPSFEDSETLYKHFMAWVSNGNAD